MTQHLFIGVDGGATRSSLRVENADGHLLGQVIGGPASVRLSVLEAWQSINTALNKVLQPLAIFLNDDQYKLHTGMGLAGCEVLEAYQAFIAHPHSFATLVVSSDSHTACLGAHKGANGAIIIAGTGVVGYQIQSEKKTQVGGWGFPHDDEGGGAWLGLEAVKLTLQCLDGRLPPSQLAEAVYNHFAKDYVHFISWANRATSSIFAELAPLVVKQSDSGCVVATGLLRRAALAIDCIGSALEKQQINPHKSLPCSLVGSIAPFLQPFLTSKLRGRLYPCQDTPEMGAIFLVREHLAKRNLVHDL